MRKRGTVRYSLEPGPIGLWFEARCGGVCVFSIARRILFPQLEPPIEKLLPTPLLCVCLSVCLSRLLQLLRDQ